MVPRRSSNRADGCPRRDHALAVPHLWRGRNHRHDRHFHAPQLLVRRGARANRREGGRVRLRLRRAARLIIKVQDEIDPQFRIATSEGDYWLAVTLPREPRERMMMLRRVSAFMAWKKALAFILASELQVPDCVYALGVMGHEVHACLARAARTPKPWTAANFGTVEWLNRAAIGQEMIDLLPQSALGDAGRAMSKTEMAMLEKWFGKEGIYPAVHIETGEVRGV